MTVYRSVAAIPADFAPSAVAIGKFDGVHAGHRAVLGSLVEEARAKGLRSVVVTFDRNPLALLRPERCPENVVGLGQKVELLEDSGVDDVVVLPFDHALADLSARDFVASILVGALRMRAVLVGADFRFGAGGAGTVDTLRELSGEFGFEVVIEPEVQGRDGGRASSTAIRTLLADGDVEGAAEMLGRPPRVRARVVHGLKRGRELGYPTANLAAAPDGFVPAEGVYAGRLVDHDAPGEPSYPAAISIGVNPTFDDVTERQVEAYVLDADLDLYGHLVDIEFVHRIRGMVAFDGIEPLIAQMAKDVDETRDALARADAAR
ncbi:bifunctional riboflavin kinase/FAD synthetase [Herbiconiux sp. L3-i23]|uniref:bifunctional riboflavin kinase/FAD synthetase n=1 Tax=Herbiconiux sp. L3-i23 TaxID=2905871 RepID=UPI002049226B|nr:bifunctional riboflavin kinase/FAD synthetase [Herbiconiux sp. L3-i23]BDI22072.1 riboflavin biosynthesis protein [Herbiconiux sp. L3-i23]